MSQLSHRENLKGLYAVALSGHLLLSVSQAHPFAVNA